MSEHTPGPWKLRLAKSQADRAGYFFLDQTQGGESYSFTRFQSGEVTLQDASLMAAAPDMLAALKGLLYLCESEGRPTAYTVVPITKAREAIARAET